MLLDVTVCYKVESNETSSFLSQRALLILCTPRQKLQINRPSEGGAYFRKAAALQDLEALASIFP